MADYESHKNSLLNQRSFTQIKGVPLETNKKLIGWIPIRPCVCVHAEGCPCDTLDDILIWLPDEIKAEKTGEKSEEGELYSYQINADTKILVENPIPMTIAQLEKAKEIAGSSCRSSVILKKAAKGKGKTIGGILIGMFELGWHIGEKIDEETGASDSISDWLSENLPWPW